MALPRFKLELLKYPRIDNFSATDPSEVAALVGFLEDRHVRQLPIEKRGPLRKPGDAWNGVFASYLNETGCPLVAAATPYTHARLLDYLRWLVSHAISLGYEENAQSLNTEAAAELASARAGLHAEGQGATSSAAAPTHVVVPPAADALIRQLAAQLHVNIDGRDPLQALQAVHRSVRQRVLPAVTAQELAASKVAGSATTSGSAGGGAGASSSSSSSVSSAAPKGGSGASRPGPLPPASELLDLRTFPLGFSTGNDVADKAGAILRMLYVTDLRELQDAVNDILVTVQEWTANPKTDASLGQVGR